MSLRFQKHIRILKGLTLNLSKSGTSWTLGGRGASINLKDGKTASNIGIPGTGLSYRSKLTVLDTVKSNPVENNNRLIIAIFIVALILLGYLLGKVA